MKTSSCKQKGRRLCKDIKEALHKVFPELEDDDIRVTPSGVPGPDLMLSPAAKKALGFYAEMKNQENISIWSCLQQAASYSQPEVPGVLFFARNRTPPHVGIPLSYFLKLLRDSHDYRKTRANQEDNLMRSVQPAAVEADDSKLFHSRIEETGRLSTWINPVGVGKRGGDEP